jgi:hypothetical protein
MLGGVNSQGRNTVKFRLTQIALSYLRIREEPSLNQTEKLEAERWMLKVGTVQVQAYYIQLLAQRIPISNHVYWGGEGRSMPGRLCGRGQRREGHEQLAINSHQHLHSSLPEGTCLAAVAVASNNRPLLEYSASLYQYFIKEVNSDGTLPAVRTQALACKG